MLSTSILLAILLVATYTDVRQQRIYNWTTYPGTVAAWVLNGAGSLVVAWQWTDPGTLQAWGWIGLGSSLLGWLVCGGIMVACFVFFSVGGGDVKLIAMIGAFLGPDAGIMAMFWAFVLGACLAVIVLIWRVGAWFLLRRLFIHLLWLFRLGRQHRLTDQERALLEPPLYLAPTALVGVVIVQSGLADWLAM